ncbi:MAG: hypothetical protein K1X72_14325 [Pyrinomonadaceae bacterium]|nr:hypothetical protein [Pyrinomonadaceae bacterium]
MAFVLSNDFGKDDGTKDYLENFKKKWKEYFSYLDSIKEKLPNSANNFATADWHYNFNDSRCPHDAWIDDVIIHENAEGDRKQFRSIEIKIVLLGAYHNGKLEIIYKNVKGYSISKIADNGDCHGDWMRDEIRLSENGLVLHEIDWLLEPNWTIECEDIEFHWKPFSYEKTMNELEKDKYNQIRNGGTGFYQQKRGLLGVYGAEAVKFLNGMITNDVAKLEDGAQMLAAFPNAQGRLQAVVRVMRTGERFLFETEEATFAVIEHNLMRWTFAGDFHVDNELQYDYECFTVWGEVPKLEGNIQFGKEVFVRKELVEEFKSKMINAVQISDEIYNILRIEDGIPLYEIDMDETTIVPELGIEGLISYNKGCYIGQEIIARIYFRGHVAKQLKGLVLSDKNVKPQDELKTLDGKNAGKITSVCYSPKLEKHIALGFVRYDYLAEGTELKVGEITATVKNLPFIEN